MNYDLTAMWKRSRNPRKRTVVLRPIIPPATIATNLYRAVYLPVIELWTAALPAIEAAYARTLSEMTTDAPEDVATGLGATDDLFTRLVLTLRLRLEQWTLSTEKWHRGKWRGAVLSATGVDIGTLLGADDVRITLGARIAENVELVRSVSDQTRARIAQAVFQGLNQRQSAEETGKAIREVVDMQRARAKRIAADQAVKIASALDEERQREAGLDEYQWKHSAKLHPRLLHVARDGKRFALGTPAGDTPGQAPFCGCVAQAVLSLD